ncbi:hypothetical protein GPECTOR_4g580 [Gonium pectorale]|uniref:Heme-binding protein 2 n=1 Tax=Gonium pectorale TaxID=33097 RepID=A0A150GXH7_GONPE|nr:hypothetical protein GPECTOR_4g580 [Gonium pectorale]|eukprot:KXZ54515.1 hypothetical protein GPECTOR_4g580 [Gonium pectorale]
MKRAAIIAAAALIAVVAAGPCLAGRIDRAGTEASGAREGKAGGLSWNPPSFCRNKDCPEFTIIQTRDDVELRRYKPAHWITTNVSNAKWGDAYDEGYKRLQKYVSGDNVNGTRMEQTNPSFTLLYVADAKARTLQSTYTIEYFVPHELQDAPPAPTAQDVGLLRVEEQDVWVLSFGGFATEDVVVQRGFDFITNLTGDGIDVHTEFIGLALYDQPARLVARHNEIWLWAKQPAPSTSTSASVSKDAKRARASAKATGSGSASASASASASGQAAEAVAKGRAAAQEAAEGIKRAFEEAWARATGDGKVESGKRSGRFSQGAGN